MAFGGARPALLSRMANWLRRRWRYSGDAADAVADAATSAQALKEVIDRKRRNEAVRQREFEHLRQLRNRGIGVSASSGSSQLSLFEPTPVDSLRERAQTLRKIERVEAQMAQRHWRPSHAAVPVPDAATATGGTLPTRNSTRPAAATLPPEDEALHAGGFAPTVIMATGGAAVGHEAGPFVARGPASPVVPTVAVPPEEPDPLGVDAALRWALGDAAGAAACLHKALHESPLRDGAAPVWRAALEEVQRAPADMAPVPVPSMTGPALAGVLCGDIDAVLTALGSGQTGLLPLDCARLTRVDFAAAGCLLSWAQAQQARGCQVQFRDVSPLVATFLRVVGVAEHAQIVQRTH